MICDEWGYVPVDREGATTISGNFDCYEQRSIILTNLEFSRWMSVYDEQMTAAIIDRLMHHCYLLILMDKLSHEAITDETVKLTKFPTGAWEKSLQKWEFSLQNIVLLRLYLINKIPIFNYREDNIPMRKVAERIDLGWLKQ